MFHVARDIVFDREGNMLEENLIDPVDMAMKRKIALVRNKLEDLIRNSKSSMEGIEFLHTSLCNAEMALAQLVPAVAYNTHENEESFIGSNGASFQSTLPSTHLLISMQGALAL
ncbi:hypothetical protein VPH35_135083 [Triticum aestivum]